MIILNLSSGELIETEIPLPYTTIEIFTDPLPENILHNLVENTIRHGGKITRISLSHEYSGEGCILCYIDDRVGIAADEKEMTFR